MRNTKHATQCNKRAIVSDTVVKYDEMCVSKNK